MSDTIDEHRERIKAERIKACAAWIDRASLTCGIPPNVEGMRIIFIYDDGAELEIKCEGRTEITLPLPVRNRKEKK